jgi:hypothetical protein
MTIEERDAAICARIERLQPLEPGLARDALMKIAYADLDFLRKYGREPGTELPEKKKQQRRNWK